MDTTIPLIVKNTDTYPVTIGWNNHFVTIEPNEARTASFDMIANFFGDPRAIDNIRSEKDGSGVVSWIPDRESEVRRLRCKWGNTFAEDESTIRGPSIEVTTLDGERVWTVLEDPAGRHANPRLIALDDQADMKATIARMEQQLETMRKMQLTGEVPQDNSTDIPTDDSPNPRRGGRISGKAAQDDN